MRGDFHSIFDDKEFKKSMKIPLFFKIWFAFVAFLVIMVFCAVGYIAYSAVSMGTEGVGHQIGSFVKAVRESAQ